MRKRLLIFLSVILLGMPAFAALQNNSDKFINKSLYENVYPSTINNTRQRQNSDTKTTTINTKNKTTTGNSSSMSSMGKRRVVKRTTNARAATTQMASKNTTSTKNRRVVPRSNVARSGTKSTVRNNTRNSNARKVRARAGTQKSNARYTTTTYNGNNSSTSTASVSSQRCFADYKECMEAYCEREDAAYNRCYCSARLAQIDSKYQNKIDSLVQQIVKLKYQVNTTDEDIKNYWDKTVGNYTGDNPWVNIDNALNINWADTESRVRGQNAFNTGHSYCVNNLRSCASMATNMRDAYRSEIARDCDAYEKSLQQIQAAAESVIESYND